MKKSARVISLTLIGILMLSLAIPSLGFADSPFKNESKNKGQSEDTFKQGPPQWILDKFSEMGESKVKFNKNQLKFDAPPVVKEGRTLIPIRALTEGMGCTVLWNGADMIVTVTHPDSDLEIIFNLKTGVVTVDGETVELDVKPGLHNNRTYVPLRFIAETFGLKVTHDSNTGNIDIGEGPVLKPAKVVFEDESDITAVNVKLVLNDYDFTGIKGLDKGTGSGDEYTYDADTHVVTLDKDYIESLDAEKTVLTFQFEDSDDNKVEKTFRIQLDFNDDSNVEEPVINPEKVTFEKSADVDDVDVALTLNGYTFEGIQGLDENDEFDVDGNTVTLDKDYISGLDNAETTLKFLFEKDGSTVKESFVIKLAYNADEDPVISPEKVKFSSVNVVTDVDVTLTLNGYTFEGIMNGNDELEKNTDYDLNGKIVTLDDDYLKDLNDEETDLTFVFEKDGHTEEVDFEVEIQN